MVVGGGEGGSVLVHSGLRLGEVRRGLGRFGWDDAVDLAISCVLRCVDERGFEI